VAQGLAEVHAHFLYLNVKPKNLLFVPEKPAKKKQNGIRLDEGGEEVEAGNQWRGDAEEVEARLQRRLPRALTKFGVLKLIDFQNSVVAKRVAASPREECPITVEGVVKHSRAFRQSPEYLFECRRPTSAGGEPYHQVNV
jgi:hypothetical protein